MCHLQIRTTSTPAHSAAPAAVRRGLCAGICSLRVWNRFRRPPDSVSQLSAPPGPRSTPKPWEKVGPSSSQPGLAEIPGLHLPEALAGNFRSRELGRSWRRHGNRGRGSRRRGNAVTDGPRRQRRARQQGVPRSLSRVPGPAGRPESPVRTSTHPRPHPHAQRPLS